MNDEQIDEFGEEGFGGEEEELDADEEMVAENGREGEGLGTENEVRGSEELGEEERENSEETSNKRIKEISVDRLSVLPDSTLIRILYFLDTKEAAVTCVLSRRWQFLWMNLPCLEFRETSGDTEKIRKFVAWVRRTLVVCNGKYLLDFEVEFRYDSLFASDVNLWVQFAVKNKVNGISLLLNSSSCKEFYTLPQMVFSNSSLERLWIRGCIMAPRRTIEWQSLTRLYLEEMELPQIVVEKILSSCPVLTNLLLRGCWGFNCLEVKQMLDVLGLGDSEDGNSDPLLEISAPFTKSLLITQYPKGRQWQLTNISCVVKANIDFNGSDWDASSEDVMSNTKELLENVRHVKELELGRQCIEVLSTMAVNGWQLPQSMRRSLKVNARCDELSVSGILALLESSPNLETLAIDGFKPSGESVTLSPAARRVLDCDLLYLKTIHITLSPDPNLAGEPFMKLAEVLLKRATILEKMVVDIAYTSDFVGVIQTLLGYPRSSKNAVIILE